jgi:hypothetical protein
VHQECRPALIILHPIPKSHGISHDHDLGSGRPRLGITTAMTVRMILRPEVSPDKDACVVGLLQRPERGIVHARVIGEPLLDLLGEYVRGAQPQTHLSKYC